MKMEVELRKNTTFLRLSSFTPHKNTTPSNKRDNTSNHEYGNPHNYSLSIIVFFEVIIIPITPQIIKIYVHGGISSEERGE